MHAVYKKVRISSFVLSSKNDKKNGKYGDWLSSGVLFFPVLWAVNSLLLEDWTLSVSLYVVKSILYDCVPLEFGVPVMDLFLAPTTFYSALQPFLLSLSSLLLLCTSLLTDTLISHLCTMEMNWQCEGGDR